jgi:hypothetical protein
VFVDIQGAVEDSADVDCFVVPYQVSEDRTGAYSYLVLKPIPTSEAQGTNWEIKRKD